MCGRFSLGTDADRLVAELGIDLVTTDLSPRFNIAPTQLAPTVVRGADGLRLGSLRWGLVPRHARTPAGAPLINARSETAHTRPAFRDSFLHRRCWIPADGFYEWETDDHGRRLPVHFRLPDHRPFVFAGLWDRWGSGDGVIASCTILTTTPSEVVRPVHDRMPVILPSGAREAWLEPDADLATLRDLLGPYTGTLEAHPVTSYVNAAGNEGPECLEPRTPRTPPDGNISLPLV